MRDYFVYILTNESGTLYTGVTNDLERRVYEHKHKLIKGFTKKYNITRLVYYEVIAGVRDAIRREKQIKAWRRKWKINLVQANNGDWADLAAGWYEIERGSESSPE